MSAPVIFILGAGPKIGLSVAGAFAAKGYKVALAARSLQDGLGEDGHLRLNIDLENPSKVRDAFDKVKAKFGIPEVVVYNGEFPQPHIDTFLTAILAAKRGVLDPEDPLSSISIEAFNSELAVNVTSPLIAAQEAVKGFKQLPKSASRTFIMTGNMLNVIAKPDVLTFGMGKTAAAHLVWSASLAYKKQGFK
jgi:NAD(P)-dependent dehydrogenase (short-subunit alcohol dehydrogenase family)